MPKKQKKAGIEFFVIYILLALVFGILVMMYLQISRTANESAVEILWEKNQFVAKELDLFFKPVQERFEEEHSFVYLNGNTGVDSTLEAHRAFSMARSNPVICCVVVADTLGTQEYYGRTRNNNRWYYFKSHFGNKTARLPDVKNWHFDGPDLKLDTQYVAKKTTYDPRERPWFRNALRDSEQVWTEPYMFATSNVPGITLSKQVKISPTKIVMFDITLESLSLKTSGIKISEHGFTFVISDSAKLIGLPHEAYANSIDSVRKFVLKDIHVLKDPLVSAAYDKWKTMNTANFKMDVNDKTYWVEFSAYTLGNINFFVGIVAPQDEIIGSIIKTKNLLFYGLILILIFSVFAGYSYRQKLRSNKQLNEKNKVIEYQKREVEMKNQEITDSITYAKRIQTSLLPTEKYIERILNKGMKKKEG